MTTAGKLGVSITKEDTMRRTFRDLNAYKFSPAERARLAGLQRTSSSPAPEPTAEQLPLPVDLPLGSRRAWRQRLAEEARRA
jgi:hypothetical protein